MAKRKNNIDDIDIVDDFELEDIDDFDPFDVLDDSYEDKKSYGNDKPRGGNATDITNDNIQDNNGNDSLLTGGSLYESSTDKYKDNLSSAITFFVCGGIGIILMILNDIGIIKIVTKDAPSFLFINIVLGLLFIGFIAIGVWSLKYSNKIKAKAETEDKKAADVLNWLEDNITKEDIENSYAGDIQEEMKYFNRTAYVKEQLTVQFTDLSDEEAENFSEQFVEKMFN